MRNVEMCWTDYYIYRGWEDHVDRISEDGQREPGIMDLHGEN